MSLTKPIFIVTGVLLAAHIAVLTLLGPHGHGPLLSNSIQLALGIVAVVAALSASRGTQGFEKWFLGLMAIRYVIWSVAQGAASFVTPGFNVPYQESTANALFHLMNLPLGVALLLDASVPALMMRSGRVSLADLAQGALLVGGVLLFSILSPTTPTSGAGWRPVTDALVAVGFYGRALVAQLPVARALFGRFTPIILLAAINDVYAGHLPIIPETGDLFDLVWAGENTLWIITAATWPSVRGEHYAGYSPIDGSVRELPIIVACFSVAVALGVWSCQRTAGALLIVAVLGCTSIHLRARRRAALHS